MKILLSLVVAAIPAAVRAQAVSPTLGAVENISIAAGVNPDISAARVDSGKPFAGTNPPAYGGSGPGAQVPPANAPAQVAPGGHNPPPPGGHNNPGPHPGNPPAGPGHNNPPPPSHPGPGHNNPPPPHTGPNHPGPNHPGPGHHEHQPSTGWAAVNIFAALVNLFSLDGNLTTGAVVAAVVITVVLVAVLI